MTEYDSRERASTIAQELEMRDALVSASSTPEHKYAVIAGCRGPERWRTVRRRVLVPGLCVPQLRLYGPSTIVIDDEAFERGAWALALSTAGAHLVSELQEVRVWADTNNVTIVGITRPLAPDVNLFEARGVSHVRIDPSISSSTDPDVARDLRSAVNLVELR